MITQIIYTSNTGTTEMYAKLLSENTGLPYCSLKEAPKIVADGTEIIYMGWLMAGEIKGYKAAAKKYKICAACGVGMGASGSQIDDVRNRNNIPQTIPVFTLQGGFDINKLSGIYKFMMKVMVKSVGKSLMEKTERTADEDRTLEMMQHGANYVSVENLKEVLDWFASQNA